MNFERFSVVSRKSFPEVVAKFEAAIGHPEMRAFGQGIAEAAGEEKLEQLVSEAVGSTGLMQFHRFDMGEVLRKELGDAAPRSFRYLVGNPVIMKEMTKHVPDAASYAPVTILIDERGDGVHLSYDTMASFLAFYQNEAALRVARDLDTKVETLLQSSAA